MPEKEPFLDVRRTAALDMALHGDRLIVLEFAIGAAACLILGALALAAGLRVIGDGLTLQLIIGLALLGAGLNYLPLLFHALDLARKHSAKEEAAEELASPASIRRYSTRQFLLLVPFAVAVMAAAQSRSR